MSLVFLCNAEFALCLSLGNDLDSDGGIYPIMFGGISGLTSAVELGCYHPVMKLSSAISSLACGTLSEIPRRSTLQLHISSTGATGQTERL